MQLALADGTPRLLHYGVVGLACTAFSGWLAAGAGTVRSMVAGGGPQVEVPGRSPGTE
jgi:hypothetical protein